MTRGALLLAAVALAGCDVEFDPIEPSDIAYSFSGYLDASADTQWVRVEPFRRTAALEDGEIDATVTLEGPGLEVVLEQEVRQFVNGPAHLFWTTGDIEVAEVYRLTARRSDGATATVPIALPDTAGVDIEVVVGGPLSCPVLARVRGADRLAELEIRYAVLLGGQPQARTTSYLSSLDRREGGTFQASVYSSTDLDEFGDVEGVQGAEVVVALTTLDWPETVGLTIEDALSDLLRTEADGLEGGTGFVGGVVSLRAELPIRGCRDPRRDR